MASSSPGKDGVDTQQEFLVGFSPFVHVETVEEEELVHKQFYKVLQEYNRNPILCNVMNTKLDLRLLKIRFNYSEGAQDQMVTANFSVKRFRDIERLQQLLKDDSLSKFMTNFLDGTGLNFELGKGVEKKIEILAYEIPSYIADSNDSSRLSTNFTVVTAPDEKTFKQEEKGKDDKKQIVVWKEPANKGIIKVQKATSILIRIYVPHEVQKISDVCVIWKGEYFQTKNIPETFIWTVRFDSFAKHHEFQMEITFIKSSRWQHFISGDLSE
ncbi:uncharacterized protein LOC134726631 [Mytilus trossulus]|uniref:uncharacterized protein LOC134726631 n=1 Tax=Mytilus trossulus TaxID=6551 RepID=UPI003003C2A8